MLGVIWTLNLLIIHIHMFQLCRFYTRFLTKNINIYVLLWVIVNNQVQTHYTEVLL